MWVRLPHSAPKPSFHSFLDDIISSLTKYEVCKAEVPFCVHYFVSDRGLDQQILVMWRWSRSVVRFCPLLLSCEQKFQTDCCLKCSCLLMEITVVECGSSVTPIVLLFSPSLVTEVLYVSIGLAVISLGAFVVYRVIRGRR